jgi:hypothetical protein
MYDGLHDVKRRMSVYAHSSGFLQITYRKCLGETPGRKRPHAGCTALHRLFSALVLSNKAGMKQGTNLQAPSTDERDQRITAGRRSDLDDWGIYRNRDFCNTGLQKARRTRRAAVIGLGFNGRFGHFIAGAMPTAEFRCEAGPSTASCY